eukprot:6915586-Lingulodinium_polyedra.AAC.1
MAARWTLSQLAFCNAPGPWGVAPRRRRAALVALVAPIPKRRVAARTQPEVSLNLLPTWGL